MTPKPGESDTNYVKLLNWLDPDQESAGIRYEQIRRGLIKFFALKRCHFVEDLSDEVFDRVAKNIDYLELEYRGEKLHYFYGVAKNVYLEYLRRPQTSSIHENFKAALFPPARDTEDKYECFRLCLRALDKNEREMLIDYYAFGAGSKTSHREIIRAKLGITLDNLRVRTFRLRNRLQKCAKRCIAEKSL